MGIRNEALTFKGGEHRRIAVLCKGDDIRHRGACAVANNDDRVLGLA